ncbi:aminoglycoside phosphotransferase family protein [Cryobacterium glaciale]|uniref:Aminoglycoside phosphotransferase family protein n=1 Tax=Cryobacterium glaciale TaxID=1259145 RepID=A0A4R8UZ55_9MICO|nr:phosphotransferase [Cryobacterium glaciale]TFB73758.1 aminoglycoside phosphotransferase family protein [Cryobacterium glaciale]
MTDHDQLRLTWPELPASIPATVENILGGAVVEAHSQANGFSPGSADRVHAANGRGAFVKAVSRERNSDTLDLHRRELAVLRMLPASLAVPRLLGFYDDGEWVALVIESIAGVHPREIPTLSEILAVLSALESLPKVRGGAGWAGVPDAVAELVSAFAGWRSIRSAGRAEALPACAYEHLDELEQLAAGAVQVVDGDYLLHLDLRSDNILFDDTGRAWLVDWPWAGVGVRWLDALTFLLDARLRGSDADVDEIIATHPLFADADDHAINAVLSGLTAYFLDAAQKPAPENTPTLRAFQRAEGVAGLVWLGERLGWKARERP